MIDLQLHTTDSDGTWAWDRVLMACLNMNLSAFAITDHDTIMRVDDIRKWARENNALAIPGIELSTTVDDQTVHLLGYFLEGPTEKLERHLAVLRQGRQERNARIISRLNQLGFDVTEPELLAVAGRATVGRPHIARLLLQKKYVQSIQEAFDRFLAHGGQAYFPKEEVPLRDGIDILHEAGAVTSVAHPMLLKMSAEDLEKSLRQWREWGLDGIEAVYPTYSLEQSAFMRRIASKYGFIMTGGSDFHGDNKPHIKIGSGTGQMHVPDDFIAPLIERKEEILKAAKTL